MRKQPEFGLVCVTQGQRCRFRTITLTQYRSLSSARRRIKLREIYWDNLSRLNRALSFCDARDIRLYRMTSGLFPMSDTPLGESVLREFTAMLSEVGRRAQRLGIRMVIHPDQFVVLNSESEKVARNSRIILEKHALWLDLMGLPRSPWSAIIIHGGKSGRGDALVDAIRQLSPGVRDRLCLENDEYCYSAAEILDVCVRAKVPMIFDNLHHAIHEKLASYEHRSIGRYVNLARKTWPSPTWQLVHLSNGSASFLDRNHSEMIAEIPRAYRAVGWIEVEARGKECAIAALRRPDLFP